MVLNVTEEQKKVIEEHGHMVIEFKKWCRDISVRITDVWNAIIFYLQQFVERVVIPCLDKLLDDCKEIFTTCVRFFNKDVSCSKRLKYPFIRSLGREYQPNFSYKVIYHRCRDRC